MKKTFILLLSFIVVGILVAGCSSTNADVNEENKNVRVIVDSLGREVEVPDKIERIASLGVMRLLTYMEVSDLVVGVTNADNMNQLTRPYTYVNSELVNLPVIAQGGAGGIVPFHEEITKVEPDVIFVTADYESPDDLSKKTGVPVVAVANPGLFDGVMEQSIHIIGEVLGKEDRAKEINEYMAKAEKELHGRTKDITDEIKSTVYNGALNFRGKHGFDGTSANYAPFDAINAKNVADQTGQSGAFHMDLEQLLAWNPDIIFLNPENMDLVNEQYRKNRDFFNSLDAVKNGQVYTQLPYNSYYTNVEMALMDAYYAGKIIYPEQFEDIHIEKKADEIFEFFLGKQLYSDFVEANLSFGKLTIGE